MDIPGIFDDLCAPALLGQIKINCLMYADDLVLLSESKNGLQNCLNKLHEYTLKWGLKLNIKKTKILIFQNGGRRETNCFHFGHRGIDIEKSYKYLGTIITDTGNFKTNEVNLKRRGLRASYIIMKNIGTETKRNLLNLTLTYRDLRREN